MRDLSLGIIGLSEGNGHPYSWSAIFNGYDKTEMASCPFPVIPEYLAKQNFPAAAIPGAKVEYIWTQDLEVSEHVARAARIPSICHELNEMVANVDAVLLARDDAENHLEMALPFINAGVPIYIDKPISLSTKELEQLYAAQQYEGQIFTCSALQFAKEFSHEALNLEQDESIKKITGQIANSWNKYAIHLIEPALKLAKVAGDFEIQVAGQGKAQYDFDELTIVIETGLPSQAPTLFIETNKHIYELTVYDYFSAFKKSLELFIKSIKTRKSIIDPELINLSVRMIEKANVEFK